MGIREVQERVSERTEKVPGRYVDGTLKASRVAERGRQRAIGNSVVVCVCVYMRSSVRACTLCVSACACVCGNVVRVARVCVCVCLRACDVLCMCVAPPCTDQKRGPNYRLLLNLIPGHPFTTI